MPEYIALYREQQPGEYHLLMVVSTHFLRQEVDGDWLNQLKDDLAEGDLWAILEVPFDSFADITQMVDGEGEPL